MESNTVAGPLCGECDITVTVEPQHLSREEIVALRQEFHQYATAVGGPEEALRRGREIWAREHGY